MTAEPSRNRDHADDRVQTVSTVADAAITAILQTQYDGIRAVVVPSPPGAGKTGVVERLAALAAGIRGERVLIVTQTNEQAFELVLRLRANFPKVPVTVFTRRGLALPDTLVRGPGLSVAHDAAALSVLPGIVVANAKKLQFSAPAAEFFHLLIVDEAWQLSNSAFLLISSLGQRHVLVGDPGQIRPVVTVDVTRWGDDPCGPHMPAPTALLAAYPDTPTITLPVSRRLVEDSAGLVQEAFYPRMPFQALERDADRRVAFRRLAVASPLDAILRRVEQGATISMLELPAAVATTADEEVASTICRLLLRVLERGIAIVTPRGTHTLDGRRLGVVCAHRPQVHAVRERLGPALASQVLVETANRYQGLERDLIIAWHPLTGRAHVHDFHVDAGRFCVMLSRHRAACILVGRAGIDTILDRYTPGDPPPLGAHGDSEFEGWSSHRAMLTRLEELNRIVALAV